jgi:ABC-type multidrug transport system fused ATPase/permease subunit
MSNILDNPNNFVEENEVGMMPVVQKYGLIMAATSVIATLLMSIMGAKNLILISVFGLVVLVAMIVIPVLGVKEHRNNQLGGHISFGRAFLVCMLILVVGMLISTIFNYVYMNFINPSYVENMKEGMIEMMEKYNLPEAQLEESMKPFDELKTPIGNLKSLGKSLAGGAVISLIVAAVMKRNRPIFS